MEKNLALAKKLTPWAYVLSVVITATVFGMRYFKFELEEPLRFLPPFHSAVNALTAVVLVFALIQIKRKNIKLHKQAIFVAMGLSLVFLLLFRRS